MARMPAESITMGWLSRGSARITSHTYEGTIWRIFHSPRTSRCWIWLGDSPVSRKYQNDSTVG